MLINRRDLGLLLASSFCVSQVGINAAQAQSADGYPKQTIKIVVGFTPGGAPDITGRFVADKLSKLWGEPVIVDNRPGAGSEIGAQYVANSTPDGYTLMCITNAHAVAPAIDAHLSYDPIKDFSGVTMLSIAPTWLLVSPSLGVKTFGDFIALAKSKPGSLNYSSAGIGSFAHFSAELLDKATGITATHVPYKGPPEALTALLSGEVQFYMSPIGAAVETVRAGRAIALAATGKERMPEFPDIPTVAESGFPGFELITWTALIAPAKTPKPIIAKLNQAVIELLKADDVKKAWSAIGVEVASSTPEELDKIIVDEVAKWKKAAKDANITVN